MPGSPCCQAMAMSMTESCDGSPPLCAEYTLVYLSFHGEGCFAFPCDKAGTVEMNGLSDRARNDYLLARVLVGRQFRSPMVVCRPAGPATTSEPPCIE